MAGDCHLSARAWVSSRVGFRPVCGNWRTYSPEIPRRINARRAASSHVPSCSSEPTASPAGFEVGDAVAPADYGKFVRFMHLASPYVVGHRGRTFVIVLPGEVIARKDRLYPLLEDITLLHGLGARLVIVVGAKELIDEYQLRSGLGTTWVGAYRVTDADTMSGAVAAAGSICTEISARLSKAPSIPMMRRHTRGEGQFHFAPAVQVVSGNYTTAKRRGIVGGVDFGLMGQVRFVQREAIQLQLDAGNIVLLSNIGVSAAGELLNCNSFDVATHAAVELQADKLICITGDDVRALGLPHYLPLDDAEDLITASVALTEGSQSELATASLDSLGRGRVFSGSEGEDTGDETDFKWEGWDGAWRRRNDFGESEGEGGGGSGRSGNGARRGASVEMQLDLDSWQQIGFPNAVLAAVVACKRGVRRAHLVDSDNDGAMLLELYTRDGITGVCMIAADLYEGIRPAEPRDAAGVTLLLQLLQSEGLQLPFPPSQAADHLGSTIVMDREGKILGCCMYADAGATPDDGVRVAEIAAFVVDPSYRRQGFGDSLLDYAEQGLRRNGFRRVAVVAGQGSLEWLEERGFELAGDASSSELLPPARRETVPTVAKLYTKPILELDASLDAPAGKRIGF